MTVRQNRLQQAKAVQHCQPDGLEPYPRANRLIDAIYQAYAC